MSKMNRRQYTTARAALVDALTARQNEVEQAINALIGPASTEAADAINNLHDAVSAAEQAIADLDRAFTTRAWVQGGEWATHDLVTQNVD